MKKSLILVGLFLAVNSVFAMNIGIKAGPDFWGDATGFNTLVTAEFQFKQIFKRMNNEQFYFFPGLGVSGVYIEDLSFMSFEIGVGVGYRFLDDKFVSIQPSLYTGLTVESRYNAYYSDDKFGLVLIPRLDLFLKLNRNLLIGPGVGYKVLFNGEYYAYSLIASLSANIGFGRYPDQLDTEEASLDKAIPDLNIIIGTDFWEDTVGLNTMAVVEYPLSSLLEKSFDENIFVGLGVSYSRLGIETNDFSFQSVDVGFRFGYHWQLGKKEKISLTPSLLVGTSIVMRENDFFNDATMGLSVFPMIEFTFRLSRNFELGLGTGAKILYRGDYHSLSLLAVASTRFGLEFDSEDVADSKIEEEKEELSDSLNAIIEEKGLDVALIDSENNEIKLNMGEVLFEAGSSDLKEEYIATIQSITELLLNYEGIYILVEGYTDDTGDEEVNQDLSEKRASNTADTFVSAGFPNDKAFYKGYGETNPLFPNDSQENRALNRRVEIRIIWSN